MTSYVQDFEVMMLFGDSLTQSGWEPGGFGQRLARAYTRKLDVVNRGFSGYNTDWAIPVFEQCFAERPEQERVPKVRILTIWFGANDASLEGSRQHVPLPRFIANLEHLMNMVASPTSSRYSPSTRIILITPPPVNTHQLEADLESKALPIVLDRLFDVTKEYADAVKNVALKEEVSVVDLWTAIWEAAGKDERALSKYLYDGLHINTAGHEILYDALIEVIAKNHPELHYETLPLVFPPWYEVDPKDLSERLTKRKLESK